MSSQSVNIALGGAAWSPEAYLLTAVALGAVPILLAVGTCYLKFSIVLGMLRSGFGTQQTPSAALIMALSTVMSLIVMQPVVDQIVHRAGLVKMQDLSRAPLSKLLGEGVGVIAPWREFMLKAAGERELAVIAGLVSKNTDGASSQETNVSKSEQSPSVTAAAKEPESVVDFSASPLPVVIGAFVLTEIKRGFIISFALLVPFFVVDLVVSNLLVGLGLTMMSPVIVSLPLKVLLFISADGWLLLVQSLVQSYQR